MTRPGPPAAGRPPAGLAATEQEVALLTERFIVVTSHVPTEELRTRTAASALAALRPAVAVQVAGRLVRLARDQAAAQDALTALALALGRGLVDQDFLAECLGLARSRADRLVEALFADGPAAREYDVNHEPFVDKRMRQLSAGEKRAMSRSRDIDTLNRLAHEQDVRIIRELLANPRLTEREALVVASRRPTHPTILEAVLQSRFATSHRIRRAVAHNPYAPVALAVRALAGLTTPELELVAHDDKVAAPVRDHARSLARGRRTTAAERAQAAGPSGQADPELESLFATLAPGVGDDELVLLDDEGREKR